MKLFVIDHQQTPEQKFDAVHEMVARFGVSIFPVSDKKPRISWKEFQERPPRLVELRQWHRQFPDTDFAMVTGRQFIVVDIDDAEARAFAEQHLPETPLKQTTPHGEHWFYRSGPEGLGCSAGSGLDIRALGGYVVVAPSEGYRWVSPGGSFLFDQLCSLEEAHIELILAYRQGSPSVSSKVTEGERNVTMTRYVGGMLQDGLMGSRLMAEAKKRNKTFDPPLENEEISAVVRSVEKREKEKISVSIDTLKGYSFEELASAEIPEATWVIPDLIPQGTSILFGAPKSGKSALLEYLVSEIPDQTLYFALEYNQLMLQKRIKKLHETGITNSNTLFFDREFSLGTHPDHQACVEQLAKKYRPHLIVIDALAQVKRENDGRYEKEYKACQELIAIAQDVGSNLVVVHHARKKNDYDEDMIDRVLGSTALAGAFDNILHFKRDGDLRIVEGRGRLVDDFQTRLVFDDGRFFIESEADSVLRGLQGSFAGQVVELLKDGPKSSQEIRELINKGKKEPNTVQISRISNTLTKLEEKVLVNRSRPRGGKWGLVTN
jgi:hypothetical protein